MIGDNRYCIDVLTQLTAAQEGVRSVSQLVIRNHLERCVRGACGDEAGANAELERLIEELMSVLKKYR